MTASTPFEPRAILKGETLDRAARIKVFDEEGAEVDFGHLISLPEAGDMRRSLVLFIRHFNCGLCQEFLAALQSKVTPESLSKAGVKLSVIGCGEAACIKPYRDLLQFPFPIFADPSKQLYQALGMTMRTLDMGAKPEYQKRSVVGNIVHSMKNALKMGSLFGAGDIKQLGGEFVFERDGSCSFANRMQNTRGHTEVATLLKEVGIEGAQTETGIEGEHQIPSQNHSQPFLADPVPIGS